MNLKTTLHGNTYQFPDIKTVLARANEPKSGDMLAGAAAESSSERVAARVVLSEITLRELRNEPAVPYERDEVTRLVDDNLDSGVFSTVQNWSVSELREYILNPDTTGEDLLKLGKGLTSECIAAAAKLMTNLDLISAASKIRVVVHANTTLGLRGRFSVRLQPNHPYDSPEGIIASAMEGLSYGNGDALIGVNPVIESVESVRKTLDSLYEFTQSWGVPTQNCCLAHVTTQMEALRQGAPMDVMFQSIAGSEKSCNAFGINVKMLEEARALIAEKGTAAGPNLMYFETGQGSELSSGGHNP
ncbi:MAG: ethanolamine ammonia-lyase subunit EutB, partial [Deltaproteobacteria bacterium]|nr:ethanolamine ammonia-lyase subunit EutB [Deltaproteobacteria bacterium]